MAEQIIDGTGTGNRTKVDSLGRLYSNSIIQDVADYHNTGGDRYNINTDDITLTSANESVLLYIKNNESRDLVVDSVIQIIGSSTGGTGQLKSYIYRNPTGGTIVTDETAATIISNLNYGSSNSLTADIFKGDEGKTQTGGSSSLTSLLTPPTTNLVRVGGIILPQGSSIAVSIQPPTGNTSMTVNIAALVYLLKSELKV
jgi:hypothetical protein